MLFKKPYLAFFLSLTSFLILAPINCVKAQDPIGIWENTQDLPIPLSSHQSFAHNNNMYVLGGGSNSTYSDQIFMAHIEANGNLGAWSIVGTLPTKTIWHSIVNKGTELYLVGGAISDPKPGNPLGVSTINKAYKAIIQDNGTITSWTELASLPKKLGRGGLIIDNNRLYYFGGLTRVSPNDTESVSSNVYYLPLDINIAASWQTSTSIPKAIAEFALFNTGSTIFIAGGMNSNGSPSNSVYQANIMTNGNILWQLISNLPTGLRRPAFTQLENIFFLMGGYNGSEFENSVYYTVLDSNSGLTNWIKSDRNIPNSCCNSATSNSKYIYILGRHDGVTYHKDVLKSEILSLLQVPSFKQTDTNWSSKIYDTANIWSPNAMGIGSWGCALTSASMLLSYYGHTINPDNLNTWLIQNNGYVGNGLINWSAITRFAKVSHDINPLLTKLEYKRYSTFNTSQMDTELNQSRPLILKLLNPLTNSTHFVVVTGHSDNEYFMNDPATSNTHLSYYPSSQWNRIDLFVPSNTNLSYLYLYLSKNASMEVENSAGVKINDEYSEEEPIENQENHSPGVGNTLKTFTLAKPVNGDYIVKIKGDGNYKLISQIYNIDANLLYKTNTGSIDTRKVDVYTLRIGSNPSIEKIDYVFLKNLLKEGYDQGKYKHKAIYITQLNLLNLSEKHYQNKQYEVAKKLITEIITISNNPNLLIEKNYSVKLIKDLQYLYNSL